MHPESAPSDPQPLLFLADKRTDTRPSGNGTSGAAPRAPVPPGGTIWRINPREQGLIGLTDAVRWFGLLGWGISMPLIDSQPYDLVVDDGTRLLRVQVKTTTHRSASGRFEVQLRTRGGNQSFHTSKNFDAAACDLLYVLTDERSRYLIPTAAFSARTSLSLGEKMAAYRIEAEHLAQSALREP